MEGFGWQYSANGGSGSYTFQNGLTESGGNVGLGGNLDNPTELTGEIFSFNNDGVNANITDGFTYASGFDFNQNGFSHVFTDFTNQRIISADSNALQISSNVIEILQQTPNTVLTLNADNELTPITLSANQSIRRNAGNTAFEAYTPVTTSTGAISGLIEYPSNKDYMIVIKAPYSGTITETTTRSTSGTCTATFKINTTALGGTANSVSSVEQSQLHASSNVFAAGDDIVITISSNSACLNMSFTIAYTYSL